MKLPCESLVIKNILVFAQTACIWERDQMEKCLKIREEEDYKNADINIPGFVSSYLFVSFKIPVIINLFVVKL